MASEWQEMTVGEIAAPGRNALVGGPFGSNLVSGDYVDQGVPVIRGQNMGERWVSGEFTYVTPKKAESLAANLARPGDIVFTQRGTLGQVSIVPPQPFERYLISQSQMKLTVDRMKADPLFVYYVFQSPEQQSHIRRNAIQTGVPHTNLGILRDTSLQLPPLLEQQAVAYILGTMDDKIELNRRMNQTLESMARALFKAWFVDFEPVRAKSEDRDTDLPPHFAELFPARLVDSELGEVPEGWHVRTISDLAEVVGGSTPSTKEPLFWEDGVYHWTTPKDLSTLSVPVLLDTERKITEEGLRQVSSGLLPIGTVLLSSRAPIGYLAIAEVPTAINQGFIALLPTEGVSNLFLLYWAEVAHDEIVSRANGSTFLEISKSNFRPIPVTQPSGPVMSAFDIQVRSLYERIVLNEKGSRTLAAIRDAMLPKLIGGEMRVKDAEKFIARIA